MHFSLLEPLLTCKRSFRKIHERVNEVPFDSDRKMMSTVHTYDESYYSMTKGAIDKLLPRCTHIFKNGKIEILTDSDKNQILKAAGAMSQEALRVLSFAFKQYDSNDVDINHLEKVLSLLVLSV